MLEAKLSQKETADILHLRGELVIDKVQDMKGMMLKLSERGGLPLIVDLSGLKFMDSYGAGFIVSLKSKLKGKKIFIAGPSQEIRNVLIRLFMADQFAIHKSVKEALRSIQKTACGMKAAV